MKKRIIIVLCMTIICVLLGVGTIFFSGDWEEIGNSTAYYYPEDTFYDLNGVPVENNNSCLFDLGFDAMEYNVLKVRCDVLMEAGEMESLALEDEKEEVIKEWMGPVTTFEEELDRDILKKMVFIAMRGSEDSQGQAIVTIYGRPKLITLIKREINYIIR